jgi:hypothetical protein
MVIVLLWFGCTAGAPRTNHHARTDTASPAVTELDTAMVVPSHAEHVAPIWAASCLACHTGPSSSEALALDAGAEALVGMASLQAPMDLVVPGSLERSYLWHKLNDSQANVAGHGTVMPIGGRLGVRDLDTIAAWILGGALP